MISLWDSSVYIPIAVSVIAVVGLLIQQIMQYVKAPDPAAKRKLLRNIVLILLIPGTVFFVTYLVIAIAFIIAFA